MKYKSILKIIVIIFLICINYTFSFAQVDDSLFMDNNSKVIILGIKKFDNLVFLSLKNKPYCTRNRRQVYVVTEKEYIKSFSYSKNNFKYSVFDTNCYILSEPFPTFARDYIIPNAPSKYLPILNKTYPNCFIIAKNLGQIVDEKIVYYERYKYYNIKYKKFMIVLVNVSLYNQYQDCLCPSSYLFRGDKAEQGMYVKVLIPLVEEDDEK